MFIDIIFSSYMITYYVHIGRSYKKSIINSDVGRFYSLTYLYSIYSTPMEFAFELTMNKTIDN